MNLCAENPELTKEATDIFIWCLSQNAECYRQWVSACIKFFLIPHFFHYSNQPSNRFNWFIVQEKLHLENVDATIAVLQNLSSEWGKYSTKISPDALRETLKNLRAKVTNLLWCFLFLDILYNC